MYYKYGASDAQFHHLGAIPMLLWQAIRAAKSAGLVELDLGRSNVEDRGLIMFKERWGARRTQLTLWRNPVDEASLSFERLQMRLARIVCTYAPHKMLILAGRLMYRHVG